MWVGVRGSILMRVPMLLRRTGDPAGTGCCGGKSDLPCRMKGRSSCKAQREFPAIRKRYRAAGSGGRGYFSTTNGAITEDIVLQYLEQHIADPAGASR